MQTIALSLTLAFAPFFLIAQSLAGEYFLSLNEGEIVLLLKEDGQNRLSGELKDTDGARYLAQATVKDKEAFGTFTNAQVGLYFEAYRQNEKLVLSIMPIDAYNQPDYLNAKEFVLSRREKVVSPIDFSRPPAERKVDGRKMEDKADPRLYGQWEDDYEGDINGTASRLSFRQYGNQLSGEIDAGGYLYSLEGTFSGNRAQGNAWDPQLQLSMKFSGILNGNLALITFSAAQGQFEMQFWRKGTKPEPARAEPAGRRQGEGLAGNWSYIKPHESGEFGGQKMKLVLKEDGNFEFGEAEEVDKPGGRVGRGKWRTQENALQINQGKGWINFAEYQPGEDILLRKYSNGNVEQWERD